MKKEAIIFVVLFTILAVIFAGAVQSAPDETQSIQKAYQCLNNQINTKTCSQLSTEEKIFALLSTGKCKNEVLSSSFNRTCWPSGSCNLEMTAKAALALNSVGANTDLPVNWILSKKGTPTDLNWFLEVDGGTTLNCKVGYNANPGDSSSYTEYDFKIEKDKKIVPQSFGPCLALANDNYWFKVNPSCYENSFQISCPSQDFISTLLYQKSGSSIYYLSPNVHSASGGGSTEEKINSYCLMSGSTCDYSGTLWGITIAKLLGNDVKDYMDYLKTNAHDSPRAFPEPFLYLLTDSLEDKSNLLSIQSGDGFWRVPNGRTDIYNTALALLPFKGYDLAEKDKAKAKLIDPGIQNSDGCWNNDNIITTAFVLYSIWPQSNTPAGNGNVYCTDYQDIGYTCVNSSLGCSAGYSEKSGFLCGESQVCCAPSGTGGGNENGTEGLTQCEIQGYSCVWTCSGEILGNYNCGSAAYVCCDTTKTPSITCSGEGGIICQSGQFCFGGTQLYTSDLNLGQQCCLSGTCADQTTDTSTSNYTCENNLGICGTSCSSGYTQDSYYTCPDGQICCMSDGGSTPPTPKSSYWWIWVLFFLIILVVIGIIYRDKIKEYIEKLKAKKSGRSPPGSPMYRGVPPRFPPNYLKKPTFSPSPPRKIVQESRPPQRFVPKKKSHKELDEVLKKLKEIGK